jgi:hypothetical protein
MAWSDRKKWWMDLLKSAITFIFGAIATIVIFNHFIDREEHKWSKAYDIQLEILDDYEKANLAYLNHSYDALKASILYGKSRDASDDIRKLEDEYVDELTTQETRLKREFRIDGVNNNIIGSYLDSLLFLRSEIHKDIYAGQPLNWPLYRDSIFENYKVKFRALNNQVIDRCRSLLKAM